MSIQKLEHCRHCLIGNVVLEVTEKNVSRMLGGPPVIEKTEICYCDNCATLFHLPAYRRAHLQASQQSKDTKSA